jgi:hypothetical protein
MKSYEARLLLLQLAQQRLGVPIDNKPGQDVPEPHEIEAYVLAQKARLAEETQPQQAFRLLDHEEFYKLAQDEKIAYLNRGTRILASRDPRARPSASTRTEQQVDLPSKKM